MDEIRQAGNVVLVIDEVHTLIGAGAAEGAIDAANILKPALARGELQCIGATTLDEYRKHIERDAALERRFQPVMVGEPTVPETIEILFGLRERYEQHHKLKILDEALEAAAKLSDRYISDRFLPDKAIDLIDEAGSRVRLMNSQLPPEAKELDRELRQLLKQKDDAVRSQDFDKAGELRDREMDIKSRIRAIASAKKSEGDGDEPFVDAEEIAHIVASWTGVPVNKLTETESEKLLHMEDTLHQRLIGQEDERVGHAIKRLRNEFKIEMSGPIPGDTMVLEKKSSNDLFIYIFHDQGLGVFKSLQGFIGSNITLGLPFYRFSPDHGTSFGLFGKNMADYRGCSYSLKEALETLKRVSNGKNSSHQGQGSQP
jgi:ATP-dependent Clp protease ATP-binding subunit ClpC